MGGGGSGGGGGYTPAPIPSSPTRWLYDRNGEATQLQEYGHYVRSQQDLNQFNLIYDNPTVNQGLYTSPELASQKNPKVWLYDQNGKTVKQIFMNGDGPNDTYDTSKYNLGPDSVPYRHWYDIYGVDQGYAPVDTALPTGMYDSPNKAPKSSVYQAPTDFTQTNPNLTVQPDNQQSGDLAAAKIASKKRRTTTQSGALTLLGDSSVTGSDGTNKSLLGQ